mmetsp:Transcript_33543/g.71497  ORF Transcript_33543/g.71497 Transcript_33543/m.71497 type:complete len:1056 (+) Transcript_33543:80-3247(+)
MLRLPSLALVPPAIAVAAALSTVTAADVVVVPSSLPGAATLLNCVDLASGSLKDDCKCAALVAPCVPSREFPSSVAGLFSDELALAPPQTEGLAKFCDVAEGCCDDEEVPVSNAEYNACWAESGAAFTFTEIAAEPPGMSEPNPAPGRPPSPFQDIFASVLDELLDTTEEIPPIDYVTEEITMLPEVAVDGGIILPDHCVKFMELIIFESMAPNLARDEVPGADSCCADNGLDSLPLHPFCVALACVDPVTAEFDAACDCGVGLDLVREPLLAQTAFSDVSDADLEKCCSPGEKNLVEFNNCIGSAWVAAKTQTDAFVGTVFQNCVDALMAGLMTDNFSSLDEVSCCADNTEHPYCIMKACEDPVTLEYDASCECTLLTDVYSHPSLDWKGDGDYIDLFLERCCTPGTSLPDAMACLDGDGPMANPPTLCTENPNATACSCLDEGGSLDESCECGAMLDLYAEDPLWGLSWGVADAATLESCCVRDETTVQEVYMCRYEKMDCGMLLGAFDDDHTEGFADCCTPGNTTVGEAQACVYAGYLKCWTKDSTLGMGYSTPVGLNQEAACASFCWDCSASNGYDGICTPEQVVSGEQVSMHLGLPVEYLSQYEAVYAYNGFSSCDTDDCNKVDACNGFVAPEIGPVGPGPDTCWVSSGELGYSAPLSVLGVEKGRGVLCFSYCMECTGGDMSCTEKQTAAGAEVSVHSYLYADSLMYYAGLPGFMSCETDDCNRADACTGANTTVGFIEHGLDGCVDRLHQGLFGLGSPLDVDSCCAANPDGPYCMYHNCIDTFTGEMDESCDCSVLVNLYTNESSPLYTPMMVQFVDSCCDPGATTLLEASECLNAPIAGNQSSICDENSDSPTCKCMNEMGQLDEACDCSVMLDLYGDSSSGIGEIFSDILGDVLDLESCCTRGDNMTIADTTICLGEGLFGGILGGLIGTYAPTNSPAPGDYPVGGDQEGLPSEAVSAPAAPASSPAEGILDNVQGEVPSEPETATGAPTKAPTTSPTKAPAASPVTPQGPFADDADPDAVTASNGAVTVGASIVATLFACAIILI